MEYVALSREAQNLVLNEKQTFITNGLFDIVENGRYIKLSRKKKKKISNFSIVFLVPFVHCWLASRHVRLCC